MPVGESIREVYVPKNPPTLVARSCQGGDAIEMSVDHYDFNIEHLVKKYSSWEWRFGNTPEFDFSFNHRFIWGEIEIGFCLKRGYIDLVRVFSDALEERLIRDIQQSLEGCSFRKDSMIERIKRVSSQSEDQQIINDIAQWLDASDL
jgi:lipoate-protein ligase A